MYHKKRELFSTTNIFIALFCIIIIFQLFSYFSLANKQDTLEKYIQTQGDVLQTQIQDNKEVMETALIEQEEKRLLLEQSTLSNLGLIQESLDTQTAKLKESLTLQQKQVDAKIKNLEEVDAALQNEVNNIQVQSNDFTAIIDEVIETVVSVRTNNGQGSGFFITTDGLVMTNFHVIQGASSITVFDSSGRAYAASVLGSAPGADLAVLELETTRKFEHLDFATQTSVGTKVIAVGNPLGLSFTVTEGIVSATNRVVDSTGIGYLQTDVPINPGNSGGPLINSAKKVIGVNTFKLDQSEGLGFAIPASLAQDIANQAIALQEE